MAYDTTRSYLYDMQAYKASAMRETMEDEQAARKEHDKARAMLTAEERRAADDAAYAQALAEVDALDAARTQRTRQAVKDSLRHAES